MRRGGWHQRTWAYLLWTLIALGGAIWFAVNEPHHIESGENYYGLWYFFIFVAWAAAMVMTWVVALLSGVLRERRELRAIGRERRGEPRRF